MAPDDQRRPELTARLMEKLGPDLTAFLMEGIPPFGWHELATKADLRDLEERLERRLDATLELRLGTLGHELRTEMQELRAELHGEVQELRTELRVDMAGLGSTVDQRLRAQTWITTTTLVAGLGIVAALANLG